MSEPKLNFDEKKLHEFMGKALADMGAAFNASLILIGDRLGLYKAMAGAGPTTSAEVAAKTGTAERYVREWLSAQAAGGYVSYDAASGKFTLPDEQAMALAVDNSPAFIPGAYQIIASTIVDEPKSGPRFKAATALAGTSTTAICSRAPSVFSGPVIPPTSPPNGFRRSKVSRRN